MGEALIKIMAAGICGSDIGAFRGTNGLVSYPRVIGHELAGVVVSIPANNKNGIKVGDRVVVDPYLYLSLIHILPRIARPFSFLLPSAAPRPAPPELPKLVFRVESVSYTHLDVYKRQGSDSPDGRQPDG